MDPDTQIMEELKRVETKTSMIFQLVGTLIAVTVAVIGLGRISEPARILMGVAQILLLVSLVPLLVAVFPRLGHGANEPFGLPAWAAGLNDDPTIRRRKLATRALAGYRMVAWSMVVLTVALVVLTVAGVIASFGS